MMDLECICCGAELDERAVDTHPVMYGLCRSCTRDFSSLEVHGVPLPIGSDAESSSWIH